MPKQKRPFVVEIEANVTVRAIDEASARKKGEKGFCERPRARRQRWRRCVDWGIRLVVSGHNRRVDGLLSSAFYQDQRNAPRDRSGS